MWNRPHVSQKDIGGVRGTTRCTQEWAQGGVDLRAIHIYADRAIAIIFTYIGQERVDLRRGNFLDIDLADIPICAPAPFLCALAHFIEWGMKPVSQDVDEVVVVGMYVALHDLPGEFFSTP